MGLLHHFGAYADARLRDFTGREWLIQLIEKHLDNPEASRFILIIGEPGIGKSAISAYLWKKAKKINVVHFCIARLGGTTEPLSFVESISEQLAHFVPKFSQLISDTHNCSVYINSIVETGSIQRGNVTGVNISMPSIQNVSPEAAFDRLIRRPLCELASQCEIGPIVILVDSLDEAITTSLHPNIVELLYKAHDLPPHVRFVLTSRYDEKVLNKFSGETKILIDSKCEENQIDIYNYLQKYLCNDEVLQKVILKSGWNEEQFISTLGIYSEGNFLYLSLILPELSCERIQLNDNKLPHGLDGYYLYILESRLGIEIWEQWGATLMEVLLSLQEPASPNQIADILGWNERETYGRIKKLDQLLDPSLQSQDKYWRYHRSLLDFFDDKGRSRTYWCDMQAGDRTIVKYYLELYGSLETGLPKLMDQSIRDFHDRYGLKHLAFHIFSVNPPKILLKLVENYNWQKARRQDDPAGSGLAIDVEYACYSAYADISELTCYAVASYLKARLRSQINTLPVEVIETFARLGELNQANELADLKTEGGPKVSIFFRLGKWCLKDGKNNEALFFSRKARIELLNLKNNENQAHDLAMLAYLFHLTDGPKEYEECLDEAFEILNSESDELKRSRRIEKFLQALEEYDPSMLKPMQIKIKELANSIKYPEYRASVLASIADLFYCFDAPNAVEILQDAISSVTASPVENDHEFSDKKISRINRFLSEKIGIIVKLGLEDQAFDMLKFVNDKSQRVKALLILGTTLLEQGKNSEVLSYIEESLSLVDTMDGIEKSDFQLELVEILLKISDVSRAKEMANSISISNEINRIAAFCAIAYNLVERDRIDEANKFIKGVGKKWGEARCKAMIGNALIKSDTEAAYIVLTESSNLSSQILEGVVGCKNDLYTLLASSIRDLAEIEPEKGRLLINSIVSKIQSEDGRNAIEINTVRENRDCALASLIEILCLPKFSRFEEGLELSKNIKSSLRKNESILLCIRSACQAGHLSRADKMLDELSDECWHLLGKIVLMGWSTNETEPLHEKIKFEKENILKCCKDYIPFIHPLGLLSLELGAAGHIEVARSIWNDNPDQFNYNLNYIKVRLIWIFMQHNQITKALIMLKDLKKGYYKAEALAIISAFQAESNLNQAKKRYERAISEIMPTDIKCWPKNGTYDEVLFILAGTIARWNPVEADRISNEWIQKEDYRKKAKGEIIAALSMNDKDSAHCRLRDLVEENANKGVSYFWESLAACSEGLINIVGADNTILLYKHILRIEADDSS